MLELATSHSAGIRAGSQPNSEQVRACRIDIPQQECNVVQHVERRQ